jgi:molybdenum cofactor biosynthesis enzyme MoaA
MESDHSLIELKDAYHSDGTKLLPEDSPFQTLFADITHRCNMSCKNCYIPIRDLPDLPVDWLYKILTRLPRRTRIRLVGAEPTMREDLPDIIRQVRKLSHIPVILSNGLKLGRPSYVRTLKSAGLKTVYLSMNGGLKDHLYEEIDELACANRKLKALDNVLAEGMNVTVGMILIPGLNVDHLPDFLAYLEQRNVRDIHLRSVGPIGDYMEDTPFDLSGLEACLRQTLGARAKLLEYKDRSGSNLDLQLGRVKYQLTAWPDLGSSERGRITPDGYVEPMFESMIANEFSY